MAERCRSLVWSQGENGKCCKLSQIYELLPAANTGARFKKTGNSRSFSAVLAACLFVGQRLSCCAAAWLFVLLRHRRCPGEKHYVNQSLCSCRTDNKLHVVVDIDIEINGEENPVALLPLRPLRPLRSPPSALSLSVRLHLWPNGSTATATARCNTETPQCAQCCSNIDKRSWRHICGCCLLLIGSVSIGLRR